MALKVLICANPDLNLIDGSSIWAQMITLVMADTGLTTVDFIAKSKPQRDELFDALRAHPRVSIIDGTHPDHWDGKSFRRLTLPMMAQLAIKLEQANAYDIVIIRGLEIAKAMQLNRNIFAKSWLYLTDIPQYVGKYTVEERQLMQKLAQNCNRLLCQSEGFKALWENLADKLDSEKIIIYPPVIPDFDKNVTPIADRPSRAIYAGKFAAEWMTLEMIGLWPCILKLSPRSELVMVGDKIHADTADPGFKVRMIAGLENTKSLIWLGAQAHDVVQSQLRRARVGLSWRAESMNTTIEYSTKILEYGGAGCAAILNRNELHESLLGKDYPLYANSSEQFVQQLGRALLDPVVSQIAADKLTKIAEGHTFTRRVEAMRNLVQASKTSLSKKTRKNRTRVLVAGHDLKFFELLQERLDRTGEFVFLIDKWTGHNKHDEKLSQSLLEEADVIFCEWCLGNLKWYSINKKPNQRLVARFHLQERELPYVKESNWKNIDHISYVSEFIRREGQRAFQFPFEKTSVIPNLLDELKFTPRKKTIEARFTLGMIGITPKRKRLDRAIDLLESLLEKDERFSLRIKGHNPLNYTWIAKRKDELDYYSEVFARINKSPLLRHKVIFDPPGDDVDNWFTMVGFLLSPSDFESFHLAIGEGMLTNAIPVIWPWDGSEEIWGARWVSKSILDATSRVLEANVDEDIRSIVLNRYDSKITAAEWGGLLRNER